MSKKIDCPLHRPDKYTGRVIVCRREEVQMPEMYRILKKRPELRMKGCTCPTAEERRTAA